MIVWNKPGLETVYGGCHDFIGVEVVPKIYHSDGTEILPKGNRDS